MKQRIFTIGMILLVLLSVSVFQGCKEDDEKTTNPTGPEMTSWPGDLPKFESGTLANMYFKDGTTEFTGATFTDISNPEIAYQNYKKALTDMGWVFEADVSNDVTWGAAYDKGSKGIHFTITKDGLIANFIYVAE